MFDSTPNTETRTGDISKTKRVYRNEFQSNKGDTDLHSFFCRLPPGTCFEKLFIEKGVVVSLFRGLPEEQKCVVLRLMSLQEAIRWEPLILWHGQDAAAALRTVTMLRSLRLLVIRKKESSSVVGSEIESATGAATRTRSTTASPVRYELHPVFKGTLLSTFKQGTSDLLGSGKPPKHFPTKSMLHAHAGVQWKNMLLWLVGTTTLNNSGLIRALQAASDNGQKTIQPNNSDLVFLLRRLKLVKEENQIVSPGNDLCSYTFHWLLRDVRSQVLSLCLEYLRTVNFGYFYTPESNDRISKELNVQNIPASTELAAKQSVEVLALMFTLSEFLIGQPCSTTTLTPAQKRFIQLAYSIGLVWMHKPSSAKHFFPTPFAKLLLTNSPYMLHVTSVASNLALLGSGAPKLPNLASLELPMELFYDKIDDTTKLLEAQLCEIRVVTPSLIVGVITRATARNAFKAGVKAEHIIRFFTTHAHPSIYIKSQKQGKQVLPENVSAQLRIWEAERHRVRKHKACVFEFSKEQDLDVFVVAVAKSQQMLIMHTPLPASSDINSPEFASWKAETLEKMKTHPSQSDEIIRATAPVLAVHAQYKDDVTNIIRAALRDATRN